MSSAYARQGLLYNRNLLSQVTRDADNGSAARSVKSNGHKHNHRNGNGGIQRFSRQQQRGATLSQHDGQQAGPEITVDHAAGGGFSLSQGTEITLTQAFEPERKMQQQCSRSRPSSGSKLRNDGHLAGQTPFALDKRGMHGRGERQHSSTPSNQKRQQMQQYQRSMMVAGYHSNSHFTTPVDGSNASNCRRNGLLSQSMHGDDDTNTIQSQSRSLLTQDSLGSRFGEQQLQQQQQQQQQSMKQSSFSAHQQSIGQQNPSMAMTPTPHLRFPSLASSRRHSIVSTAVRTFGGGISSTLATLGTPSKAFRSMKSFATRTAARTGATLGLTPCNFRSRSSLLLSSRKMTSTTSSGTAGTAAAAAAATSSGTAQSSSLSLFQSSNVNEEADDTSKITQKTYDHSKDGGVSLLTRQEDNEKEKESAVIDDFISKVQIAIDEKMKQYDDKLNEKFAEKKQELEEFFDRTRKTFNESITKMEGIQEAMDAFSAKIVASAQEQERQILQLVGQAKEEIGNESLRIVESMSTNARAVAEGDEVKKSISDVVSNVIAVAKSEFQVWTDGVLAGMREGMIGNGQTVLASGGEELTIAGIDGSIETMQCEEKERCQSNSDKENEEPVTEDMTNLSEEEADYTEPCSLLKIQKCNDHKSGAKWSEESDDEKEVSKKGGTTPFSSKATPHQHHRSGISTTTTPFSRKTTPLKNNYGKNRKSSILSSRSDYDDELQSELQNDFHVVMSPYSKMLSSSSKKKRWGSPAFPQVESRKVKLAKKAPKLESKHKITTKPPNPKKPPTHSPVNIDKVTDKSPEVKQNSTVDLDELADESAKQNMSHKSVNAPPSQFSQRSERKRDQSVLNEAEENNSRRSKRLKESNRAEKASLKSRAEQAALKTQKKKAKAAKAKQVTPLDDGTRQNRINNPISSKFCPSPPESNYDCNLGLHDPLDELVGTSVIVAEGGEGEGDDSSGVGLDDSPTEKRPLSLFTFGLGLGNSSRSKAKSRKSKDYSSKSRRKKSNNTKTSVEVGWTYRY